MKVLFAVLLLILALAAVPTANAAPACGIEGGDVVCATGVDPCDARARVYDVEDQPHQYSGDCTVLGCTVGVSNAGLSRPECV